MKSHEKSKEAESLATRSSQPKKKFASLFARQYAVRMIVIIINIDQDTIQTLI